MAEKTLVKVDPAVFRHMSDGDFSRLLRTGKINAFDVRSTVAREIANAMLANDDLEGAELRLKYAMRGSPQTGIDLAVSMLQTQYPKAQAAERAQRRGR